MADRRRAMVAAVRRGQSQREVARRFGVALSTVQRWVERAASRRLDRIDWNDWNDSSRAPKRTKRTTASMERRILAIRRRLKDKSALGEYGAQAIRREMQALEIASSPSIRTIGRILERRGALDRRKRQRRPAPLRGWYLPDLAAQECELDSFDTIEGLAIRGGSYLTILTGVSLHGGLTVAWSERHVTAKRVVDALLEHWGEIGMPGYAQFDNDNRFQGPKKHADTVGRVSRMCMSLGVVPVFAPPRETGFQAAIESFNGRWQAKVWSRFEHRSLRGLRNRSDNYVDAARARHAIRIEAAPARRAIPKRWRLNLQTHPQGKIIYIRRTNDQGHASLLGHSFAVDPHWTHRLVRAEVDLGADTIRFHALRRREPTHQPLLAEARYILPKKPFKE
jgi:transposase-like protein